ncbi:uncharacterized protein LOC110027117 [Phalaenopsis equestris]|uniref:uncharacterized protein LOC110027117 n=1 Tax=Phalaenopsis equestris TaxID=78828 RepID=UPI0009E46CEB|nr:uncharacterized protein LOC110027117 [Phalaenopsis equestris]
MRAEIRISEKNRKLVSERANRPRYSDSRNNLPALSSFPLRNPQPPFNRPLHHNVLYYPHYSRRRQQAVDAVHLGFSRHLSLFPSNQVSRNGRCRSQPRVFRCPALDPHQNHSRTRRAHSSPRRDAKLQPTASSPASASSSAASAVSAASGNARQYEFLEEMRAACEAVLPKARVRVEKVEIEGREKAATILEQTKRLGVGLLVIGQRRSSSSFLACTRGGSMSGRGLDTAEFLIENCKCRCVSVQKRVYNCGYILNTKTHKNFWHIA